jgi:DNA-binding response OmpR family regulator
VTTGAAGSDSSSDIARDTPLTVFVSDPSAEAEKITQALRAAGYAVVDVPMSMLIARVAVQTPRLILVDADAEGALDAISRLRDLPDAEAIDVVFIGKEGAALQGPEDAMAHEGSGFFSRPVDVPALVRKVQVLTGGPVGKDAPARTSSPPSVGGQQPAAAAGDEKARPMSLPPASMRTT